MQKTAATHKSGKNASRAGTRSDSPAALVDERIGELGDWRGKTLARVRKIVMSADPAVIEEWKWNVPVWSHPGAGIICTGEAYKKAVKLTFAKGASLKDPSGLFNSSLEGHTRRAIDLHEGDGVDERALQALVRAAVALKASSAVGANKAKSAGASVAGRPRKKPKSV